MKPYALLPDQVWDGSTEQSQAGMAVVVNCPNIEALCSVGDLPRNIEIRKLDGCTLLPGLMDAHVHYSASMGPAFLAAGVTTIRDVGNDLESILVQRARNAQNPSAGPAMLCCGYLIDGSHAYWKNMGRPHTNADAIRATIRQEAARGVDAIKLYAGIDLELLRVAVEESHKNGKPILAHLGAVTAEDAARAGLDEIQHLTGCAAAWKNSSSAEKDTLIDVLLEHEVIMTPTLVVWDRLGRILDLPFLNDARRQWVHPVFLDVWNLYLSRFGPAQGRLRFQEPMPWLKNCLARMQERGVTIALGTDTPFPHLIPGFSLHDELCMYVDAGITPVDALRSATSVGARVLGVQSHMGKIAAGMVANLVAVKGNPLKRIEDIGNIECTIRDGQIFHPKDLLRAFRDFCQEVPQDAITTDLLSYVNGR